MKEQFKDYLNFCETYELDANKGKTIEQYKRYRDELYFKELKNLGFLTSLNKKYHFKTYYCRGDRKRDNTNVFVEDYVITTNGHEERYKNDILALKSIIDRRLS